MAGIQRYDPFDGALGFALATRIGSLVFTAGMVGVDPTTGIVPDDLETEFRLIFSNLADVLREMGSSFERVVEQTSFLVGDQAVYDLFQQVRGEVFADRPPASTSVFVQGLLAGAHCEVKLVATVPD
jgi:2-iminobutanoate/2-iminopropanoate deaminase